MTPKFFIKRKETWIVQRNKDGEQNWYKRFGRFSLAILLSSGVIGAQSFEDFKNSQAKSFAQYKDERDAAFSSYLKEQWKEYNAQMSKPLYEKPKPKNIIPAKIRKIEEVGPRVHIVVKPIKEKIKVAKVIAPIQKKEIEEKIKPIEKELEEKKSQPIIKVVVIEPVVKAIKEVELELVEVMKKDVDLNFYGSSLGFIISQTIKDAKYYPQNQEGVANFFNAMASSEYEDLILSIKTIKKDMKLNDWAVYLLVKDIAQKVFFNPDEVNLFSWFIFNKLGYDVKVGLASKHVILMHYSKKLIYSTPNYTFSKRKFYVVSHYAKGKVGSLYTYKQSYPDATKPLDLSLKVLPNFKETLKTKTVSFKQYGKTYNSTYEYNQNIIDFMATYPQADYETYFNAPLDERTYSAIAQDIKKYIDGKKASVAMNFVLNFVQNAFDYEVDDKQFGREKVMFAQETLYFNKSDCEDRAILYSYLMKELFHVSVVGVKYSDHMATALYIPMKGDSVKDGRRKYVIADPTYINANIGMSMPKYKSVIPDSFVVVKE